MPLKLVLCAPLLCFITNKQTTIPYPTTLVNKLSALSFSLSLSCYKRTYKTRVFFLGSCVCQLITLHCSRIVIVVNAFSSVCVFLYEQTYDQFVMFSKVQRLLEIFSKVSSALLNAMIA